MPTHGSAENTTERPRLLQLLLALWLEHVRSDALRHAEITDFDIGATREQNILRLQILQERTALSANLLEKTR